LVTFTELGLGQPFLQAVANMGFEEPTPIQKQTIPIAMAGRDLIGQAQTGTGKTAAYGIPMVERIAVEAEQIQGMVIPPTRELAVQVAEELNRIGQFKGIRALPIYGGQDINRQIKALQKKPHIICAVQRPFRDYRNGSRSVPRHAPHQFRDLLEIIGKSLLYTRTKLRQNTAVDRRFSL